MLPVHKGSLFVLLPGVIRRLEQQLNSEQKVENIFDVPPYWQTACQRLFWVLKGFRICRLCPSQSPANFIEIGHSYKSL
jgi:hypothetical protein